MRSPQTGESGDRITVLAADGWGVWLVGVLGEMFAWPLVEGVGVSHLSFDH